MMEVKIVRKSMRFDEVISEENDLIAWIDEYVGQLHEIADDEERKLCTGDLGKYLWERTDSEQLVIAAKAVGALEALIEVAALLGEDVPQKYQDYVLVL